MSWDEIPFHATPGRNAILPGEPLSYIWRSDRNRYPISGARTVGAIAVGFFPLSRFDHLARTFRGTACVADVYVSV